MSASISSTRLPPAASTAAKLALVKDLPIPGVGPVKQHHVVARIKHGKLQRGAQAAQAFDTWVFGMRNGQQVSCLAPGS